MKRIKIHNKIGFMIFKIYGKVPLYLVKDIVKFIQTNYRRRKYKPYVRKKGYTCITCNTRLRPGEMCKCAVKKGIQYATKNN